MRHQVILKSITCARTSGWLYGPALLGVFLIFLSSPSVADESPSAAAGSATALTSGCADCHGVDGLARENLDAPVISGMPAAHIEEAIYAYRDGARQCRYEPLMCETVLHTSDERIADLAEHYADQRRGPSNEPYNAELAAKGEKIHEKYCADCHVQPDDPEVADALGIPLHGQRGVYVRYALQSYKDGRRKNLLDAMGEKLKQVDSDGIEALVNYYASY
ncbi:MAG: c-type cytochrome [Woeseiaceae bacterium]